MDRTMSIEILPTANPLWWHFIQSPIVEY